MNRLFLLLPSLLLVACTPMEEGIPTGYFRQQNLRL